MPETALVPYRTQALSKIEPIDTELIPDCGRAEKSKLEMEAATALIGLHAYVDRKTNRARLKTLAIMVGTAWTALFVTAYLYATSASAVIALAGALLFLSIVVTGNHEFGVPDSEEYRLLKSRLADRRQKLEKVETLERLTGKTTLADALLMQADCFNRDISTLDADECTPAELELIAERRREIVSRIHDFRQKVLAPPREPAQIAAPADDRT